MFWAIVGIVIICAICSIASSAEDSANAAKANTQKILESDASARYARKIAAFQILITEEFPDDAARFTYAAVDQSYKAYFGAYSDPRNRPRFTMFDASKFKSPEDRRAVVEDAINRGAGSISEDFRRKVMSTIDNRIRFERAILAAETRAG